MNTQPPGPSVASQSVMNARAATTAVGIGFELAGLLICAAAVALMLALAAWLWFASAGGLLPGMLLALLLASAAGCLAGGSHALPARSMASLALALQAAALACAFAAILAGVTSVLRGVLAPPPAASLLRVGLWSCVLLGCAATLAWLPGAWIWPQIRHWGGRLAVVAAMVLALVGAISLYNPWWGMVPASVPGLPIFNGLLAGCALPATGLLLGLAQWQKLGGAALHSTAKAAAGVLAALWLLLETRRAFTGPDLTISAATLPSVWVWLAGLCLGAIAGLYGLRLLSQRRRADSLSESHAATLWQPAAPIPASRLPALRPPAAPNPRLAPSASVSGPVSRRSKHTDPNWAPPV